ncbi:MAG TPA: DUF3151 family protein [Acidimicrobiales bacterium]|nr:DUF3151 family protein [Acidimicrobiales bacterium]
MPDRPVELSSGLPETVLPPPSEEAGRRLADALRQPPERRRDAVADVVAAFPRYLEAWARLGELGRDDVEAYACFRVGYHRGLDALRAAGWRGSGYVRWSHEANRGFLMAVEGLRQMAAVLGESDEEERCAQFLRQLDPTWDSRLARGTD